MTKTEHHTTTTPATRKRRVSSTQRAALVRMVKREGFGADATGLPLSTSATVRALVERGLIERAGFDLAGPLYRLTPAGRAAVGAPEPCTEAAPVAAPTVGPDTPGAFFCRECGAWLLQGGVVHDEGEHEPRERAGGAS